MKSILKKITDHLLPDRRRTVALKKRALEKKLRAAGASAELAKLTVAEVFGAGK